jgi:Ran GTPase-activating protein (RanGAP) involved in mRNA processing and transport
MFINGGRVDRGLTSVLQALARHPTLTKLGLRSCPFGPDNARLLQLALCSTPSFQSLYQVNNDLGSIELAELAPALYRNTSIKVLDMSRNGLVDMESAVILQNILRHNKTMAALVLSGNRFGRNSRAVDYIAEGLGSNSDLSNCSLGDGGVSILAQTLGSRNTTLQKLSLECNSITSTGFGVLLETMNQSSHHITDLDLRINSIRNEGASLLARSLENNALPNFTRLSLLRGAVGDDGIIALMSALEHNTSLLQLDLNN